MSESVKKHLKKSLREVQGLKAEIRERHPSHRLFAFKQLHHLELTLKETVRDFVALDRALGAS